MAALAAMLGFAGPAWASASDLSGRWAVHAGGRTLVLIDVAPDKAAPGTWDIDFIRPSGLSLTSSHMASGMAAGVEHRRMHSVAVSGDAMTIKYAHPTPDQVDDAYILAPVAGGFATWGFKNAPFEPILLVRARAGETVEGGWDKDRDYPLDEPWPSNAEMTRLYDEDQAARQSDHIDWTIVGPQDAARRARTKALLDAGALHSADDFLHAAFLFQHGDTPRDYLLAHGLAIIAAAKGRRDASWIAAASLDRYLQSIGQKQVYGTQYQLRPGQKATQEPYDRGIISDAIRIATGVPTQAEQERQRAQYDAPAPAAPKP
ncbi:MAG TPA: hypothetical protein VFW19_01630 [Allosphingosinicella sp.]|nr:hypothetical protein [Allosphingosinicella sp.]